MAALARIFPGATSKFGKERARVVLICLTLLLFILFFISVGKGALPISPAQCLAIIAKQVGINLPYAFDLPQQETFINIRLPRVILGILVGAGLGVSGAAMQGLFRNPLADPSLIGISSGSALAATAFIILGDIFPFALPGFIALLAFPISAFIGGLLTTFIVYRLSTLAGQTVVATMLLAGIAINALAQAGSGLLTFFATDVQIRSITFWRLGSLGGSTWTTVGVAAPFILLPVLFFPKLARALNALLLGEFEAGHLGVNIERVKRLTVVLVAMIVGACVAVTGLISFVGLVVPHLLRLMLGPDHRHLLPGSALFGASLLLGADLIARTVVAPAEMPIGILTTLIGAPFFLWLLLRDHKWRLVH